MFVAFELQIRFEAKVNELRVDHLAYEEGRILKAQPLLKVYKEAHENLNGVDATSVPSSLDGKSEDHNDFELISSVLEGNFVNCKYRSLGKTKITRKGTALFALKKLFINNKRTDPISPERLCLNNKRLNIWADQNKVVVLDGPFELDRSRRYSVDLMSFRVDTRIRGISVGLFAYFGPYLVQISALFLEENHAEKISLIKPGVNFLTMESISMLPPQCNGVVLVAWGEPDYSENRCNKVRPTLTELKESYYHGMELVLDQYEELSE